MAEQHTEPHTVNHDLRHRVLSAIGIDRTRIVADTLSRYDVTQSEREHLYYPCILGWLESGIGEIGILPEDLAVACIDLTQKHPDGIAGGRLLAALKGFTRTAALSRLERELEQRERWGREDAARGHRCIPIGAAVMVMRAVAPPEYREMIETAMRLCRELRQVGRSPRELPDDLALWPATYLPQQGPQP